VHRSSGLLLVCVILLLIGGGLSQSSRAQNLDNTVFRFLNLPTSARAAALGGSHISLSDGGISVFQQNPAYLDPDQHREVALSYINHLHDVSLGFISGAYQINSYGTAGVGIRYVNYGEIDKKDEHGNSLGSFRAKDLSVSLGFGRTLSSHFQYGGSVDFIYSGMDIYQSTGIGFNLGAIYKRPDQSLTIGASLNNAGYQTSTFANRRERLPLNMAIAVTKRLAHSPLRISVMGTKLNHWPRRIATESKHPDFLKDVMRHLVVGGEFIISSNVFLRVGYNYYKHEQLKTKERLDMAGFSYGMGFTIRNIQFDFSRNSYSKIGALTQLSIQTSL
jgi:hypothetical protein